MDSFPLSVNLEGRKVVIAGGGAEALRKARLFVEAGAEIVIIAPHIDPSLYDELTGRAALIEASPTRADFHRATLAVIADAPEDDAARYAEWARASGALVNVVDQPSLCDFTTPSIIDRGDVVISIATGGAAPVLAQQLRGRIEALAPARLGALAKFAKDYRSAVKATVPFKNRREFWRRVFNGPIAAQVLAGDDVGAHEAMIAAINAPQSAFKTGVVHIVGAGPGDPELLTLKAHRLIQEADVILYDKLVSKEILSLARRDADRVFVGKQKANHAMPQSEIEAMMVRRARNGETVVRLKGGDPFVFGRGGEELDAMRAAGVDAHVTPGVTAAIGCAASSGMPLTHRDFAQSVTFVTGHATNDSEPDIDWRALAALKNTLVVYMGVTRAEAIRDRLIEAGRDPKTPAAIIENGSRENQRVVKGSLQELDDLVTNYEIQGPAILVVGDVAAMAEETILEIRHQTKRAVA